MSDTILQFMTFLGYFALLLLVVIFSYKKQQSEAEFVLGNRSLNFWLTALSAQASDMSSWLFLAYPALVFGGGLIAAWAAIGLTIGMFLNWHYVAPRLRRLTEQFGSLTLSAYFEKRFRDPTGQLRLISGLMSVVFFTIYIASGLVAMGILVESLLGLSYYIGTVLGLVMVVGYVFAGGYRTVAWIDLFQGFFLLGVILFIPIYLLLQIGGMSPVFQAIALQGLPTSLFPDWTLHSLWQIFVIAAGWGLGYFGQPHILTKFMGIRDPSEMGKAKILGMSWLVVALGAATLVGLIGISLFPEGLKDPQQLILSIVKTTMAPFFAALVLCAILAATTNVMAAHLLIAASNLSEDLYKKCLRHHPSSRHLLWISRMSVVLVAVIALIVAFYRPSTIYQLVLYAWSGLGASFGPLVLLSLYIKNLNKFGAFAGIFFGGTTVAFWPYIDRLYHLDVAPIIPAFALSVVATCAVSYLTNRFLKSD